MSRLLIMACSATKAPNPKQIPAHDRYTGPVWQTYKAVDPARKLAHLSVLSAEHGWIPGGKMIADYDTRMDAERAGEILDEGFNDNIAAILNSASDFGRNKITEVCIVGGHRYQHVARELVAEAAGRMVTFPPFARDFRITVICNQIGYMRQQLRAWLAAGTQQVAA